MASLGTSLHKLMKMVKKDPKNNIAKKAVDYIIGERQASGVPLNIHEPINEKEIKRISNIVRSDDETKTKNFKNVSSIQHKNKGNFDAEVDKFLQEHGISEFGIPYNELSEELLNKADLSNVSLDDLINKEYNKYTNLSDFDEDDFVKFNDTLKHNQVLYRKDIFDENLENLTNYPVNKRQDLLDKEKILEQRRNEFYNKKNRYFTEGNIIPEENNPFSLSLVEQIIDEYSDIPFTEFNSKVLNDKIAVYNLLKNIEKRLPKKGDAVRINPNHKRQLSYANRRYTNMDDPIQGDTFNEDFDMFDLEDYIQRENITNPYLKSYLEAELRKLNPKDAYDAEIIRQLEQKL